MVLLVLLSVLLPRDPGYLGRELVLGSLGSSSSVTVLLLLLLLPTGTKSDLWRELVLGSSSSVTVPPPTQGPGVSWERTGSWFS